MTAMTSQPVGRQTHWWLTLINGISLIILGILLLMNPVGSTFFLVQFLGIYWLVSGLFSLVGIFVNPHLWGWKLFSGILGVIAGVMILQHPIWAGVLVPTTLVIVLAIQGIIVGIVGLILAFQGAGLGSGILGAVSIIFGVILLGQPLLAALALPMVLGSFAVVGGVVTLVHSFRIRGSQQPGP